MEDAPLFDGGLNTKAYPTDLPMNQTPSAQNVDFNDFGAVGSTKGFSILNSTAIGSAVINGLKSYNNESSTAAELLLVGNGSAWRMSGTTAVTIGSGQSIFTNNVDMDMHQFRDVMFYTNGSDRSYKWNGAEFTKMGVSAVTDTMTAATNAAGTLTGGYNYVRAGVNSYAVEGDYSVDNAISSTFTAAGEAITVGGISTAPVSHGIESWNIYRNTAAAAGTYYRVTNVANGVTSFVDDNSDSTLVTAAPLDNGPPFNFKYFQNFEGYMFAAGYSTEKSLLYWSKVNTPELWPIDNFVRVGQGDGLEISGISVENSSILIAKSDNQGNTATYTLFNDDTDPANWYLLKTDDDQGSSSHKVLTRSDNKITFLNGDGFFSFSGNQRVRGAGSTELGKISVDTISADIEPDVQAFKKSLLKGSAGVDYENRMYFAVPSTGSSTENDKVYVFDYVRLSTSDRRSGAWIPFTDHNINQFAVHDDALYGGSSIANGFIYKLQDSNNFNGAAIDSFFTTATFKGKRDQENRKKVFRHAYIWMDTSGDWPVEVSPIVDFDTDGASATQISLKAEDSALWNTAQWDADVWASSVARKRFRLDMNAVGFYLQLKFRTNTISQFFKISRIQIYYNLKGKE